MWHLSVDAQVINMIIMFWRLIFRETNCQGSGGLNVTLLETPNDLVATWRFEICLGPWIQIPRPWDILRFVYINVGIIKQPSPWCSVGLETSVISLPTTKLLASERTPNFIIILTTAHHWSLSHLKPADVLIPYFSNVCFNVIIPSNAYVYHLTWLDFPV